MDQEKRELTLEQMETVSAGNQTLGVYRPGLPYKEASLDFFRQCVGDKAYESAMNSPVGKRHHYVVARAFLNQSDWEKFVWIEEHGSLDGFPK